LSVNTLSAPWLIRLNWDELATLIVCVSLDVVEYIAPVLMMPVAGDFVDFAGIIFCVYFFSWVGFISLLELIPGMDFMPIFTLTWLVWYIYKRRDARIRIEQELDRWK